jgi:L-lactate dehydrogenase
VPADIADDVAEHLVEADRSGYVSHGLSILPNYRRAIESGNVNPTGRAACVLDRDMLMVFDGNGGFGQHVGKTVMTRAIERVRQHGHCIVTLRKSHHLGRMGHYGEMVAHAGFVLLSFTNVINRPPVVAPFGGRVPRLTTNPLCFAGPMPNGRPPLVVDIATSAIAINKARVLAEKGEPAPENSIIDAEGNPTTDAGSCSTINRDRCCRLAPTRATGLGVVAELLAGVLSGGGTIQPDNPRGGVATNNLFAVLPESRARSRHQLGTGRGRGLRALPARHAACAGLRPGAVSGRVRGHASRRCGNASGDQSEDLEPSGSVGGGSRGGYAGGVGR